VVLREEKRNFTGMLKIQVNHEQII
jgi:hypothetical protein